MFTYHSANTSAAQPALVNAIEQGLRADLPADHQLCGKRAAPYSVKPAMLYRQP